MKHGKRSEMIFLGSLLITFEVLNVFQDNLGKLKNWLDPPKIQSIKSSEACLSPWSIRFKTVKSFSKINKWYLFPEVEPKFFEPPCCILCLVFSCTFSNRSVYTDLNWSFFPPEKIYFKYLECNWHAKNPLFANVQHF